MTNAFAVVSLGAVVILALLRAIQTSPSIGSQFGAVLALLAGIAPALWVTSAQGVPLKIVVGYGVGFFIVSVLLKWMLFRALSTFAYPHLPVTVVAIVQGILSSLCEMGIALLAIRLALPDTGVWQVFGFAAGAAAAEALILSMMANPHEGTAHGEYVAAQFKKLHEGPVWLAAAVPLTERTIATADHLACRGLLAIGVRAGWMWPIALAFVAFALTDCLAGYCLGRKWEFSQPLIAAKLYGPMALVAAISITAWTLAVHALRGAG